MPLICAATSSELRYGSSPVVVRLRPHCGMRSRSLCGPNIPVTMNARLSAPSVWPQTLPSERSNDAARPISVIGAVDPLAFGPDVLSTPCASVQQMSWMLGVVPVEASTGPTLWQLTLFGLKIVGRATQPLAVFAGVSCSSRSAFASSACVGGLLGSSCAMRLSTAGVYGAVSAPADGSPIVRTRAVAPSAREAPVRRLPKRRRTIPAMTDSPLRGGTGREIAQTVTNPGEFVKGLASASGGSRDTDRAPAADAAPA